MIIKIISNLLLALLSPVFFYIAVVIVKDLIPYIKYLIYYKGQGIKYEYIPLIGYLKFYSGTKDLKDKSMYLVDIANRKHKGEKLFACNSMKSTNTVLVLKDPKLIVKFLLVEMECSVRKILLKNYFPLNIVFTHKAESIRLRTIFNQFFLTSNLKLYVPTVYKLVNKNMQALKESYRNRKDKSKEYFQVNVYKLLEKIFCEISNELMFGNQLKIDDEEMIPELIIDFINMSYNRLSKNRLNAMLFGIPDILGLSKHNDKLKNMADKIGKNIMGIITQRRKAGNFTGRKMNVIDMMLEYNSKAKEEDKIPDDKIVSNTTVIHAAAADTSMNAIDCFISYMARNPEKAAKFQNEILPTIFKTEADKVDYDVYEQNEYLSALIKENLRRFGPSNIAFVREMVKDTVIEGYKIKKKTSVFIPTYSIHMNGDLFENPKKFNEGRFLKNSPDYKNIIKGSYIPFLMGKRACPGKYLADLFMKITICCFFENFELNPNAELNEMEMHVKFVYCMKESILEMKPRESK